MLSNRATATAPPRQALRAKHQVHKNPCQNNPVYQGPPYLNATVNMGGRIPLYMARTTPSSDARMAANSPLTLTRAADGAVCILTRMVSSG